MAAQTFSCDPQADFMFKVNGCMVSFAPSFTGSNVISHEWRFTDIDAFVSTTDIPNPTHTFNPGNDVRTVEHRITLLVGDAAVTYTCTKPVNVVCEGFDYCMRSFSYEAHRCTVKIVSRNPGTFEFGDGTSASGNNLTHVYAQSGTYTISYFVFGEEFPCTKTIQVNCDSNCCDAAFTASIQRECSALYLRVTPECKDGTHKWELVGGCAQLKGNPAQLPLTQVTNVNTNLQPTVTLKHTYTCKNGLILTSIQTLTIPEPGIYIGEVDATTALSEFECALPGPSYAGSLPVYVTGIVKVDKSFAFDGTNVWMHPGMTGFDVLSGLTLSLTNTAKVRGNAACNCLWRGIYVWGRLVTNDAFIEDAVFAGRAYSSCTISLTNTRFLKNFIGIRATDGGFLLQKFLRNNFDGTGSLKGICELMPLVGDVTVPMKTGGDINVETLSSTGYQTERGFAGMYLREIGLLNLIALPLADQNTFQNLAVGIDAYNTNVNAVRSARFSDIHAGAYNIFGGIALRFYDGNIAGNNTLSFIGNRAVGVAQPDFSACTEGIRMFARQSARSSVNISNCRMQNMQQGVYLDAIGNAAFFGNRGSARFKGIVNNHITADVRFELIQLAGIFQVGGVNIKDNSPAATNLEIKTNTITLRFSNDPASYVSSPFCIGVVGSVPENVTGVVQVDVHRNRLVVEQGFAYTAVYVQYTGARVRDNNDQTVLVDGPCGIYANANGATGYLVEVKGGNRNTVACNQIVTDVPAVNGSLSITTHADGIFAGNELVGAQDGVEFEGPCGTMTKFRCNTMDGNNNNSYIGLAYSGNAVTGPQGSFNAASGNRWLNIPLPSGIIARSIRHQTTLSGGDSPYFFRNINNERPTNVTEYTSWFFPVPDATPVECIITCPITPLGEEEPPIEEFNETDNLVAADALQYAQYDAITRWWNKRNLYDKLARAPHLLAGNTAANTFKSAQETLPLGQLAGISWGVAALAQLESGKIALKNNLELEGDLLQQQVEQADSVLSFGENAQWATQREQWMASLRAKQDAGGALSGEIQSSVQAQAIVLAASLAAVSPSNICETNEKKVLAMYLKRALSDQGLSAAEMADLHAIAVQCPLAAGPAVHSARSLYTAWIGPLEPVSDCSGSGRSGQTEDRSSEGGSFSGWMALSPNPADTYLNVQLGGLSDGASPALTLVNVWGQVVRRLDVARPDTRLDTSTLSPGLYFVRIEQAGRLLFAKPVSVGH